MHLSMRSHVDYNIFLSYLHNNARKVEQILKALQTAG